MQAIQQTGYQGPLSLEYSTISSGAVILNWWPGRLSCACSSDGWVNRLEGAEASLLPEKVQIGHLEYIECVIPPPTLPIIGIF